MPLRFTLRQLEYLVAVGECGSIALASDKVNVSSPSISAAISQLEQEFGLPLFVRKHAHGLSLTQGGKQFVEQAKVVLAQAARLNDLANTITGKVRGPLNVGCLLTFAQVVLPHLRRGFVDVNPEVDFHQFERNQSEIFDGLRQHHLGLFDELLAALGQREAMRVFAHEKRQAELLLQLRDRGGDRRGRDIDPVRRHRDIATFADSDQIFQLPQGKAQGHGLSLFDLD